LHIERKTYLHKFAYGLVPLASEEVTFYNTIKEDIKENNKKVNVVCIKED